MVGKACFLQESYSSAVCRCWNTCQRAEANTNNYHGSPTNRQSLPEEFPMLSKYQLNDVYLLKTSGLPLLAGCTGTDFCKTHMEQHILTSGLLAAVHSFSQETFQSSTLHSINYNNIRISFMFDKDIILSFVTSSDSNNRRIKRDLTKTWNRFQEKYGDFVRSDVPFDDAHFLGFSRDLIDLGVIGNEMNSAMGAQIVNESTQKAKPTLTKWLTSIFG